MKPFPLGIAVLLVAWVVWRWRRSSTGQKGIGLVVAAGLGVYGSGLVEFPDLEKLIEDAGSTLGAWTYLLVGALTFLETGAFLSFVAPGEFTILFGGVVAGQGEINVVVLIGIVWFCAVAGDTTSFLLGRKLGRDFLLRHGARVKITEERLVQVERFYQRHGGPTVFIGRFVGLLRALGPFIAGASRMRFSTFLPYDVLGGGLWGTGLVLLGFFFWHSFDTLKGIVSRGAFGLGALIVVVVGSIWAYRHLRDADNRAQARAWLDEQARRPVIGPVVRAGDRLWRRLVRPVGRRFVPPVRFFWQRITPGQLGLELTTLLAIAAVGSFGFFGLAIIVADDPTLGSDRRAARYAGDVNTSAGVDAAEVVTWLGSLPVVATLLIAFAGWLLWRRREPEAISLLAGGVLTYAGVHIAKAAVDRPRPAAPLVDTVGSSFPSGHAAYSVALVAIAAAVWRAVPGLVRRAGIILVAVVLTAVVGLTRVYLRAHFLTDVVGGWGLGAMVFSLCGLVALVVAFLRQNGRRPGARRPSGAA